MKDHSLIYSPIGGAGEIGMNMYAYGFKKKNKVSYILVDAGVSFPKPDTEPGVDLIFPNPKLILDNLGDLEGRFGESLCVLFSWCKSFFSCMVFVFFLYYNAYMIFFNLYINMLDVLCMYYICISYN